MATQDYDTSPAACAKIIALGYSPFAVALLTGGRATVKNITVLALNLWLLSGLLAPFLYPSLLAIPSEGADVIAPENLFGSMLRLSAWYNFKAVGNTAGISSTHLMPSLFWWYATKLCAFQLCTCCPRWGTSLSSRKRGHRIGF